MIDPEVVGYPHEWDWCLLRACSREVTIDDYPYCKEHAGMENFPLFLNGLYRHYSNGKTYRLLGPIVFAGNYASKYQDVQLAYVDVESGVMYYRPVNEFVEILGESNVKRLTGSGYIQAEENTKFYRFEYIPNPADQPLLL